MEPEQVGLELLAACRLLFVMPAACEAVVVVVVVIFAFSFSHLFVVGKPNAQPFVPKAACLADNLLLLAD